MLSKNVTGIFYEAPPAHNLRRSGCTSAGNVPLCHFSPRS